MMAIVPYIGVLAVVVAWSVSEYQGSRKWRLFLGSLSIALVWFFGMLGGGTELYYAELNNARSARLMEAMLERGQVRQVQKALANYNLRRGIMSRLAASVELRDALEVPQQVRSPARPQRP